MVAKSTKNRRKQQQLQKQAEKLRVQPVSTNLRTGPKNTPPKVKELRGQTQPSPRVDSAVSIAAPNQSSSSQKILRTCPCQPYAITS